MSLVQESRPTVTTSAKPPMFYDYYGFPPEASSLQFRALNAINRSLCADPATTGCKGCALAKFGSGLLFCSPSVGACAVQTMRFQAETRLIVCASPLQAYKIDFPAPGDPALAARVNSLLRYV